jgi:hypothetical protein
MTEEEWKERHLKQFEFSVRNVVKRSLFWVFTFLVVFLLTGTEKPISALTIALPILFSVGGALGEIWMQRYFFKRGDIQLPKYPKYSF